MSEQIHSFLEGISLADLVSKSEVKKISENQDRKQLLVGESIDLKEVNELQVPA